MPILFQIKTGSTFGESACIPLEKDLASELAGKAATWNSVEDGDQWGISAAYAADGLTLSASTDEGSDWSVSGSMALGGGASVVAGTNYTEDAYVGVSFAF